MRQELPIHLTGCVVLFFLKTPHMTILVARFLTGHSQQKFPEFKISNLLPHRNVKNYTLLYFIAYLTKTQGFFYIFFFFSYIFRLDIKRRVTPSFNI